MSSILDRKKTEVRAKHASLQKDFDYWQDLATKGHGLHTSQLAGLLGPNGAFSELNQDLADSVRKLGDCPPEQALKKARSIESVLLAQHCLWGYFREKLAQRLDDGARPFLDAADELAWRCYEPAMRHAGVKREPPLIFLNGRLSPVMFPRGASWNIASPRKEFQNDPKYAKALERLPIPVIAVPFSQLTHPTELIFVAHETGHVVEGDFQLTETLQSALRTRLAGSAALPRWEKWLGECFADAWAIAHTGPAFAGALQDFLAPDHLHPGSELYPAVPLRLRLSRALATELGFPEEAARFHAQWTEAGLNDAPSREDADLPGIVAVLLHTPLIAGASARELGGYTSKRHQEALTAATQAINGYPIQESDSLVLFSALRRCFEDAPAKFEPSADGSLSATFLKLLRPSDTVRSERSSISTPPKLLDMLLPDDEDE